MKTVHGDKVKVECWREYIWDPDCLGCWMWTCPCHQICERGRGIEMMLKAMAHIRKHHPRGAGRATLGTSSGSTPGHSNSAR